jgi:hypothetical protein
MTKDATWAVPVCDDLLRKVIAWYINYEKGDPSADRPYISKNGRVVNKVTRWANRFRFKPNELNHLIRILDALTPTRELVDYFKLVQKGLRNSVLIPGGEYEVVLECHPEDVKETLQTLLYAKTGKPQSLDEVIKQTPVEEGKSPFEV